LAHGLFERLRLTDMAGLPLGSRRPRRARAAGRIGGL
jgi:hypothetical protein